jgi:hypothetical protein
MDENALFEEPKNALGIPRPAKAKAQLLNPEDPTHTFDWCCNGGG